MFCVESFFVPLCNKFYNNFIVSKEKEEIIVLGQGWLVKGFLDNINHSNYKITNITRHDFVNTPMLLSTINKDITNINVISNRHKIDVLIKDNITNIDLINKNVITTENKYSFNNKYLVCGLGSNTDNGIFWLDKIKEIKKLKESKKICIVGAGPTGTELAFHLNDLNHKITLLDGLPNVYTFLTPAGKQFMLDRLEELNVKLFVNKMYSNNDASNFDLVIFAVGSRSNDLTSKWKLTNKLNLEGYENVFSGGDGIVSQYPKNAQVAYQQGCYIAQRLNKKAYKVNGPDNDFKFESQGISLYCGKDKYYVENSMIINKFLMNIYYIFK